ncbi:hypothetical protein FJU08_01290 [Martelella alba]|uniref:Helix-turn-helix domain-containing protein n=1 Tax=Martelella alba TaxID=2590451 RepID=A0A506UIT3_9HYPH|nr:hypothetical protein [Martelella alba]TPW33227.1 hypothetical protein FJU08_01290 [Martelella alba]
MGERTPYKPDQTQALAAIERRRQVLAVSHADLAHTAGLSQATWRRIRREKRAFPAQVNALRYALRTIEKRRQVEDQSFPESDDV